MHNFKELKVWKSSVQLSKSIYTLTKTFPTDERFGLTSQMNRGVVSITQLIIAKEFDYINDEILNITANAIT